jgi:prepilin-type N-terminal cleavage/methylation domain-containing protein
MTRHETNNQGFTLIEVLVVLTLILILFGLSTVNLGQQETNTSVSSATDTLLADISSQQLLAMNGDTGSTSTAEPHGIYFQPSQYTLFASPTYSATDSNNFVLSATNNISFSTTFPSGTLIFNKGDGSVENFISGDNTITISGIKGSETITVDRFGAVSLN